MARIIQTISLDNESFLILNRFFGEDSNYKSNFSKWVRDKLKELDLATTNKEQNGESNI